MEYKTCKQCNAKFLVTDEDLKFYKKISPVINGQTYLIPPPTMCPDCRLQRLLCWRTETNFSRIKCEYSGEEVLSMYSPNTPYTVYDYQYWNSDKWDPMSYGRDFDFDRPFFEQFFEMAMQVPVPARAAHDNENCEYIMAGLNSKNCYMAYVMNHSQDCMYGNWVSYSRNCLDCFQVWECELCYEVVDGKNCYDCSYSQGITNCRQSMLLRDCQGCQNCFGCVNLNNKQYWVFNQETDKEEYEKIVAEFKFGSPEVKDNLKCKFKELLTNTPRRYAKNYNAENSTGNYLTNCKNVRHSFAVSESEDVAYSNSCTQAKDCQDIVNSGYGSELMYNMVASGVKSQCLISGLFVFGDCSHVYYSMNCDKGLRDCFGCCGLHKKQYCILNKQYTKDEYQELMARIIEHMQSTGEWGDFFPMSMSPWAYNETKAQTFYPLQKEGALKLGVRWQDDEQQSSNYSGEYVEPLDIRMYNPEHNQDAEAEIDKLLAGAIKCTVTGKPFRVISPELSFYIKQQIPVPGQHPEVRIAGRLATISHSKLFTRQCDCVDSGHDHKGRCSNEFETSYAPDRTEKVYCEQCYQKSVI